MDLVDQPIRSPCIRHVKVLGAVDWNVIMMIKGTMGKVSLFINSKMPSLLADFISDLTLIYFGLLVGATLGGNMTPIGASANIAGLGILRKEGWEVKPRQFMKISVPFTLAAVASGYLLVWLIWA